MQEENLILKRINESLKEKGNLTESDLKIIRTQLNYRDEYLELIEKFSSNPYVVAYLMMKETGSCSEMFETFANHHRVKSYNFMIEEVKSINELESQLKQNEWCHHILLSNSKNVYQCVRCGVLVDEKFHCRNYVLLNNCDYDEGRSLYDEAIGILEEADSVTNIINKMLDIKRNKKINSKRYIW